MNEYEQMITTIMMMIRGEKTSLGCLNGRPHKNELIIVVFVAFFVSNANNTLI